MLTRYETIQLGEQLAELVDSLRAIEARLDDDNPDAVAMTMLAAARRHLLITMLPVRRAVEQLAAGHALPIDE